MKKIVLSVLMMALLILPNAAFAEDSAKMKDGEEKVIGKIYSVPVFLKNAHADKESMGNKALDQNAKVLVKDAKVTYTLNAKPMKFKGMEGNVTKFFIYETDAKSAKVEATKTASDVEGYKDAFTFERKKEMEKEVNVAVWVDVMDELQGGEGKGEQNAILVFDWDKAKELEVIKEEKAEAKEEKKEETKEEAKEEKMMGDPSVLDIMVNGKIIKTDVAPYITKGRTMVPVRFISESLGLKVAWDGETKTVSIGEGDKLVKLVINSDKITKADGSQVTIESPAVIKNSRTMVPVRAVAELSGAKVDWNGKTRTVLIEK